MNLTHCTRKNGTKGTLVEWFTGTRGSVSRDRKRNHRTSGSTILLTAQTLSANGQPSVRFVKKTIARLTAWPIWAILCRRNGGYEDEPDSYRQSKS